MTIPRETLPLLGRHEERAGMVKKSHIYYQNEDEYGIVEQGFYWFGGGALFVTPWHSIREATR
jgi:hypothetical protein